MVNRVSWRCAKVKSGGLSTVSNHNMRVSTMEHRGVDPAKTKDNKCLFRKHDMSLDEAVRHDLKERGIKVNKNSTIALEMLSTASTAYFRPEDPNKKGAYDMEATKQWALANLAAYKERYGENLIQVDLHLDESTPHMHVIVVPVVMKEHKKRRTNAQIEAGEPNVTYMKATLDADSMTKRGDMIAGQDYFAKAVEHLGIQRGIKGSRAKHTTLKQWGGMIQEALKGFVYPPKAKIKPKELEHKVLRKGFLGIGKKLESEVDYYKRMSSLYQALGAKQVNELLARETKNKAVIKVLEVRNKTDRDRAYLLEQFKDHPQEFISLQEQLKRSLDEQQKLAQENQQLQIKSDTWEVKAKQLHHSNIKLQDANNDNSPTRRR